jgi:spore maturation protein B
VQVVQLISLWLIPSLIVFILLYGTYKRVPTYEAFVEGGKEGIQIAFSLIPYLVGMLVSIAIFRTSGALDYFIQFIKPFIEPFGLPSEVVPLAIIRPISGTASLGIVTDLIATYGPDSFIGRLASTIQGSTETTLYVLTVYFGAVGIRKMGDALKVGLLADAISFILSFFIVLLIFGR